MLIGGLYFGAFFVALALAAPGDLNGELQEVLGGAAGDCNFNGNFTHTNCAGSVPPCSGTWTTRIQPAQGVMMTQQYDHNEQCTGDGCRRVTADYLMPADPPCTQIKAP